jgi:hypothetical protein
MSKDAKRIRSLTVTMRHAAVAAVLLAAAALAPTHAAGDDATRTASGLVLAVDEAGIVVRRSAEPDLRLTVDPATHVARDGQSTSVSDLRPGEEVRAAYAETNGVAKAIRIDAQGSSEGTNVRTMSPDDPEWNQTHDGG